MVRQAHHERNQYVTVHPELVEGFNQRFLRAKPVHHSIEQQMKFGNIDDGNLVLTDQNSASFTECQKTITGRT
jgi:hypothetical protein